MQGIKFYEPEVVGDTPEAVEYHGMQNLLAAVKEHVGYRSGKLIFSADGQVGNVLLCLYFQAQALITQHVMTRPRMSEASFPAAITGEL